MPRQAKFDRDEIIQAAADIVEAKGLNFLTARSLGEKLGASARPIFTVFSNMEEVVRGVHGYAEAIYKTYVDRGLKSSPAFKGVGSAYIKFAGEHPKLFQLLFMKERGDVPDLNSVLGIIEGSYGEILNSITQNYNVGEAFAKRLYLHMWIYTHGIAVLTVNRMCTFGAEEISDMLTEVFKSLIKNEVIKND